MEILVGRRNDHAAKTHQHLGTAQLVDCRPFRGIDAGKADQFFRRSAHIVGDESVGNFRPQVSALEPQYDGRRHGCILRPMMIGVGRRDRTEELEIVPAQPRAASHQRRRLAQQGLPKLFGGLPNMSMTVNDHAYNGRILSIGADASIQMQSQISRYRLPRAAANPPAHPAWQTAHRSPAHWT